MLTHGGVQNFVSQESKCTVVTADVVFPPTPTPPPPLPPLLQCLQFVDCHVTSCCYHWHLPGSHFSLHCGTASSYHRQSVMQIQPNCKFSHQTITVRASLTNQFRRRMVMTKVRMSRIGMISLIQGKGNLTVSILLGLMPIGFF